MGLVTADISVSLDLVAAGREQSLEHPFGPHVGERLHTWMFEHGDDSPDEAAGILRARAYVMGRHMFGPDRGDGDDLASRDGQGREHGTLSPPAEVHNRTVPGGRQLAEHAQVQPRVPVHLIPTSVGSNPTASGALAVPGPGIG